MGDFDTDLFIVGAGPTGLAAGVDALRHGLTVRLVEQRTERARLSKALVVHARTMEVFEALGVADAVLAKGQRFRALNVRPVRDMSPIRVDLLERPWGDTRFPFWLSTPQYDVEQALEDRFVALGGRVEWGAPLEGLRQEDDRVVATVGGRPHVARWVLACDGGRSAARGMVGLGLPRQGLGATFALADAWTSSDLVEDEGHAVLTAAGVLLVVPMPGRGLWRLIAEVTDDFDPASLDGWAALVRERAGFDLRLQRLGWSSKFDLTGGVATRFRERRVFLLGDAAHVHSPVGGQGLNTGAQDAHNLVWKLKLAKDGGLDVATREALLDSYERERRPIAQQMVRMTSLATRVLTVKHPVPRLVRSTVGRLVVRTSAFQDRLSRGVGMLDLASDGAPRLENPVLADGRRLHDVLHPLSPTLLRWRGRDVLVRPDRVVAREGLVPASLAVRAEVA